MIEHETLKADILSRIKSRRMRGDEENGCILITLEEAETFRQLLSAPNMQAGMEAYLASYDQDYDLMDRLTAFLKAALSLSPAPPLQRLEG